MTDILSYFGQITEMSQRRKQDWNCSKVNNAAVKKLCKGMLAFRSAGARQQIQWPVVKHWRRHVPEI